MSNAESIVLDLTLAGNVGELSRQVFAQTWQATATVAENRFYFVQNSRSGTD